MPHYKVKWEIDIEADTPEEAAQQALEIQRNTQSTATVFTICKENGDEIKSIDLTPDGK